MKNLKSVKAGQIIYSNHRVDGRRCGYKVNSLRSIELVEPHKDLFRDVPSFKSGKWKEYARFEVCTKWLTVRGFKFID